MGEIISGMERSVTVKNNLNVFVNTVSKFVKKYGLFLNLSYKIARWCPVFFTLLNW